MDYIKISVNLNSDKNYIAAKFELISHLASYSQFSQNRTYISCSKCKHKYHGFKIITVN